MFERFDTFVLFHDCVALDSMVFCTPAWDDNIGNEKTFDVDH